MTIDQVIHTIISWDTLLSKGMKKYIHYYSMRNFAIHYPEIPDQEALKYISDLLTLYVEEVIANNYNFNSKSGYYLGEKYLNKLSPYYRSMLSFSSRLQFKYVLLLGIPADGLLYITGISSHWHFPAVTIALFLYYLFITFLKEPKGYVYGFFY
jgi:hypothetical protein